MDRNFFQQTMNGEGTLDYELHLNTPKLLTCQKVARGSERHQGPE